MNSLMDSYAYEYDTLLDKRMYSEDGQGKAYNPVVFLILGDSIQDSIEVIQGEINRRWDNSCGIVYFNIFSNHGKNGGSIIDLKINTPDVCIKNLRKAIYDEFYRNEEMLAELNKKVRQLKIKTLENGKVYASFQNINLAVVTRADEPLNVILPEIALLIKSKLAEDFKMVSTDLFILFGSEDGEGDFGYSQAASMAFFREIEYIQSPKFRFNAPLEVLSEGVRIDVNNGGVPVFDIVYMLENRNEDGIIPHNAAERNYKIISYISLLKNRKIDSGGSPDNESYNNDYFKKSISPETGSLGYATAGLSWVKRPNQAIAMTVLSHYCRMYMERLMKEIDLDDRDMLKLLRLDDVSLDSRIYSIIGDFSIVDDMMAIMSSEVSPNDLDGMTLQEAEIRLYGDSCIRFFNENYGKSVLNSPAGNSIEAEVKDYLKSSIVNNPRYGLYNAYLWTLPEHIMRYTGEITRSLQNNMDLLNKELSMIYGERIILTAVQKSVFGRKQALRGIKRNIIDKVYSQKLQIAKLKMKQELVRKYELAIESFNAGTGKRVNELKIFKSQIRDSALKLINTAEWYMNKNIDEYYDKIVTDITSELSLKWGEDFYFDDRFIGKYNDIDGLSSKLIESCKKYILSNERLFDTFEIELLNRANIGSEYGDKNVLSQEELFRDLYQVLKKDSGVSAYIMEFTARYKHEEKYFFGDFEGSFIQYAFSIDKNSRTYKLGCVNERRASGIEELNLMGGFTLNSLVYARNSYKYYCTYLKEGYELHGIEPDCLPEISF